MAGACSTRWTTRRFRYPRAVAATATSTRAATRWRPGPRSWPRTVAARVPVRMVEHRGRQEPARPGRHDAHRDSRTTDRPAHRGRTAVREHHRLFGVRPPGDESAVAVPDTVEPEGELLVAGRPPVV